MPPSPLDDATLLRRAQRGDRACLEALVARHWPAMRRLALVLTAEPALAEDAAQDAVLRWMRTLSRQDATRPVGPWIRTLVRHACVDLHRRRSRRSEVAEREVSTLPRVEHQLDLHRGLGHALDALRGLPPRQRELIELCDRQGLTPTEAADELGITASAARAQLSTARKRLRLTLLRARPELADLVRAS